MQLKDISETITHDNKDVCSKCRTPFAWPGGNEWHFLSCFLTETGDKLCSYCALDEHNRIVAEFGEKEITPDSIMEWTDTQLFQTVYDSLEESWALDEIKRRFYLREGDF